MMYFCRLTNVSRNVVDLPFFLLAILFFVVSMVCHCFVFVFFLLCVSGCVREV